MTDPLATLHDIHLPSSMWLIPLSVGVVFIVGLLIIVLARRWFVRTAMQRIALQELDQIMSLHHQNKDDGQLVLSMSQLLRRFSQKRWPEVDCLTLTGEDWLEFLEAHNGTGEFVDGAGAVLAWRPYSVAGEVEPLALQALLQRWFKENSL